LTEEQQEYAFAELMKDINLFETINDLQKTQKQHRKQVFTNAARCMIQRTFKGNDSGAMLSRAGVGLVGDVVGRLAGTVYHSGTIISNTLVAVILIGIDLYRWSNHEIDSTELMMNLGEHVCGAAAGTLATYLIGAMCPLGAAGVALGVALALCGSTAADYFARKFYRKSIIDGGSAQVVETEEEAKERAVREAAKGLGIDLQNDGFARAKKIFRNLILDNHPDRSGQHGVEDSQEAALILAQWQIVRGHYERLNKLDDGDHHKEPEVVISMWVMKVRQSVHAKWELVRAWFAPLENEPVSTGELEMVENKLFYM
jgi:hypothetical protein